jgi:hypothetical protein
MEKLLDDVLTCAERLRGVPNDVEGTRTALEATRETLAGHDEVPEDIVWIVQRAHGALSLTQATHLEFERSWVEQQLTGWHYLNK